MEIIIRHDGKLVSYRPDGFNWTNYEKANFVFATVECTNSEAQKLFTTNTPTDDIFNPIIKEAYLADLTITSCDLDTFKTKLEYR